MRRIAALILAIPLLCGCAPAEPASSEFWAMNTAMSVRIYGDESLLGEAESLVYSLEQKLSVTDERSEIYALNSRGEGEVSPDTAELIEFALEVCESTGGALDISVYPVVRAWGFTGDEYRVPSEGELSELLESVGYERVELSGGAVTLGEGMRLDLGAVAKGYASDRIVELLREKGVKSALLNLGGNIHTLGAKPDGSPWNVAVADPLRGGYLGTLDARDAAVVTSGGYERYFELDGVRYCHIIDPSDGHPVSNGLESVTVVGGSGALCDALSTALFVMGLDRAGEYWRENGGFEAIFLTTDGELFVTAGLEDRFVPQGEYTPSVILDGADA